jgi:hypothetical protein
VGGSGADGLAGEVARVPLGEDRQGAGAVGAHVAEAERGGEEGAA